jgi:hypothetical protein
MQLAYSPSRGSEAQNFYTSINSSTRSFGFGFGYFGSLGSVKTVNGGFVGFGYRDDNSCYGLSYQNKDLTVSSAAKFDFSYTYYDPREGLSYGGVIRSLNSSPQATLGAGYVVDKNFNIELNVQSPPINQLSLGDYTILAAANFSMGNKMTTHLQLDYSTKLSKIGPIVAFNYWTSDFSSVSLQFMTPNIWSVGASLML